MALQMSVVQLKQTYAEEQRKHTRYGITAIAHVYFTANRQIAVGVVDLSFEGLCIEADTDELIKMLPEINLATGYDKVPLWVHFDIVLGGKNHTIKLLSSSIYLKPVSVLKSQMGLQIVDVETGVLELADYISSL